MAIPSSSTLQGMAPPCATNGSGDRVKTCSCFRAEAAGTGLQHSAILASAISQPL